MAGGGWSRRGYGVPLEDRVRTDVPAGLPAVSLDGAADPGAACPARHCWVAGAADAEGIKRPGLLLEWRRVAHGAGGRWEGRVVYLARLRPLEAGGGWAAVEEWLPAELLLPL